MGSDVDQSSDGSYWNFHINLSLGRISLATPVVLWCGLPFFQRFWTSLINRSPNMFTLIGLGTGVAYAYSVVATVAPHIFPPSPHMPRYLGFTTDVGCTA